MTLDMLKDGQRAAVVRVTGEGAMRSRLLDMGFTRSSVIEITGRAPLGDPIKMSVMGCELTLRRSDARAVEVTPVV